MQLVEGEARVLPPEWGALGSRLGCLEASPSLPSSPCCINYCKLLDYLDQVSCRHRSYLKRLHNLPLFYVSEKQGRKINLKDLFHIWGQVTQNPLNQDSKMSDEHGFGVRLRVSSAGDPVRVTSSLRALLYSCEVELTILLQELNEQECKAFCMVPQKPQNPEIYPRWWPHNPWSTYPPPASLLAAQAP